MNFISAQFVVLFPLVLLAWRLTPQRGRWAVLLAASWLFYLGGQAAAFPLLLLATGVCYLAALRIAATARPSARRGWLKVWATVNRPSFSAYRRFSSVILGSSSTMTTVYMVCLFLRCFPSGADGR